MTILPRPIFSRFIFVAALAAMVSEQSMPMRAVADTAATTSYRPATAARSTGEAQVIADGEVGALLMFFRETLGSVWPGAAPAGRRYPHPTCETCWRLT